MPMDVILNVLNQQNIIATIITQQRRVLLFTLPAIIAKTSSVVRRQSVHSVPQERHIDCIGTRPEEVTTTGSRHLKIADDAVVLP